ncbi:GntR family transcriptional regulator [Arthrobacter pigmenti]
MLPKSKTQYVYEWLREQIVQGQLSPGEPIRQQYVAQTLGVSFTPVREAIRRLESVGLVSHSNNHGASVNELSPDAIQELYLLRGVMEGLGARLAARKYSRDELLELENIHTEMSQLLDSDEAVGGQLASLSREFHAKINMIGGSAVIAPRVQEIWATFPIPRSQTLWDSKSHAAQAFAFHGQILQAFRERDSSTAAELMERHIAASAEYRSARSF